MLDRPLSMAQMALFEDSPMIPSRRSSSLHTSSSEHHHEEQKTVKEEKEEELVDMSAIFANDDSSIPVTGDFYSLTATKDKDVVDSSDQAESSQKVPSYSMLKSSQSEKMHADKVEAKKLPRHLRRSVTSDSYGMTQQAAYPAMVAPPLPVVYAPLSRSGSDHTSLASNSYDSFRLSSSTRSFSSSDFFRLSRISNRSYRRDLLCHQHYQYHMMNMSWQYVLLCFRKKNVRE